MSLRVSAERGLERITCSIAIKRLRLFTHGVIPGQSHTEALGISSPGIDEARLLSLCNYRRGAMEHYVGLDDR